MKSHALPVVVLWLSAACGGANPEAAAPRPMPQVEQPATPAALAAPAPPKLRLGTDVTPTHYAVDLRVVPTAEGFDGKVAIDVEIAKPIGGLWLHGNELEVKQATLTPRGGQPIAATPLPRPKGAEGFIGLGLASTAGPGAATLTIEFSGKLQPVETLGLFRQKDGDDWYAFTQFETTDASRAFPCFDDPRWKTPWDLTLRVPKEDVAVANTSQISETPDENGLKAVRFATSKPLPSYLIAFAVGPFGIVDAGTTRGGAKLRIITLRGGESAGRYAAEVTGRIVALLEDYLGVPYPYDKLDSIAVPKTVAFGAMENPGLITYQRNIITVPPGQETVGFRQRYASIAAHETAHLWFGDLVTLTWWDETWLNESLANWGGSRAMERFAPEWRENVERVTERNRALGSDAAITARPVRRPVESDDDMLDVFSYTAYAKGQAILHMVEGWVGAEAFRKGIHAYLTSHAHGNVVTADLTRALSDAAGMDVAPVIAAFLDQAGAPRVSLELSCPADGAPRIAIGQTRHLNLGGEPPSTATRWPVPVCVRYGTGEESGRACTLLEGEQGVLELPTRSCPEWVVPNADGTGYYVSLPRGDLASRFTSQAKRRYSIAEQVVLVSDLGLLMRAAMLPAGEYMATVAALEPARDQYLADVAGTGVSQIGRDLVTAPQRAAYARYINKLYGARARKLGFTVRPGEDDSTRELRSDIVPTVAVDGRDRALMSKARELAARWLDDKKSVDPDLVGTVLWTAVAGSTASDRALFDRLLAELGKNKASSERRALITALGAIRDPELVDDVLTALTAPGNDLRETWSRTLFFSGVRESRRATYQFIDAHFEELAARMARPARAGLVRAGALLCDEAGLAHYQKAFEKRAAGVLEGPTTFGDTLASVRACIAFERAQRASLDGFLRRF